MKESTKAKLKVKWGKAKRFVKDHAGTIFLGATSAAAWSGWSRANKLQKEVNDLGDVVNNNARCARYDRQRIEHLQEQNMLLMERALKMTEGKAE